MANMNTWSYGSSTAPDLTTGYPRGMQNTEDKYALYLKLFSGELFKAYQNSTIARELVTRRTLRNGKSMQFIFTGDLKAHYHKPGTQILGKAPDGSDNSPYDSGYTDTSNSMDVAEKTIICDDLLIASTFVNNLEEIFAHYDLRGEIAKKLAYSLADAYDVNIFRTAFKAATEGPVTKHHATDATKRTPVRGQTGGNVLYLGSGTTAVNDATLLVKSFFKAAELFDRNNVPDTGRVAVLPPESYYNLITQIGSNVISRLDPINRDAQGTAIQSGEGVYSIAGISIRKSNNVDQIELLSANRVSGQNNDYSHAKSGLCGGLIFHKDSVGVVEAVGPTVETTSGDTKVMYQGDLIVGKVAMGAGTLNPAGAIALCGGGTMVAGDVEGGFHTIS